MQLSQDALGRASRLLLAIGMALTWAGAGGLATHAAEPAPAAPATPTAETPEDAQALQAAAEQIERSCRAVAAAEREIPRDTFDPPAIVAKVGRDSSKLFEWVRDNTFWVPYQGALRGPVGVLADRLGNNLDRSLLLGEVLRAAGFDVRLCHATLSEQQGKDLLANLRPVPADWRPQTDGLAQDVLDKSLAHQATEFGLELPQLQAAMRQQIVRSEKLAEDMAQQVAELNPALARAFPSPKTDPSSDASVSEAIRDHWWVQVEQDGRSVDLDLLSPEPSGKAVARAQERLSLSPQPRRLPPELKSCHEITIRLVIEQLKAGKLTEHTVLKHTLRPAEVIGDSIYLAHVSPDWQGELEPGKGEDPTQPLKEAVLKQSRWVPTLVVGNDRIIQSGFSANGDVTDKPTLDPANLLGQGAGKTLGGMGGMLGGGEEPEQAKGQLSAEWVEYEVRAPGQATQSVRRELFDLVGPAARAGAKVADRKFSPAQELDRALALFGQVQVLPQVCHYSAAFVEEMASRAVLDNQALALELLRTAAQGRSLDAARMKVQLFPGELYSLAMARSRFSPTRGDFHFDRPNILTFHRGLAAGPRSVVEFRAFDIVANDVAIVPGRKVDAFRLRLEQGVLETVAESVLLDGSLPGSNCAAMFSASAAKGEAWTLLRAPSDLAQAKLDLSPDQKARLAAELKAGYAVMTPARALTLDGRDAFGWWRVDPRTGQSLGMGARGWGDAAAEKAALDYMIATWKFRYAVASGVLCVTFSRKSLRGTACCALGTILSVTLAGIATSLATVHVGGVGGLVVTLCSKLSPAASGAGNH